MKILAKFLYIFVALLPFQFALNVAPGFDLSVIRVIILFLFGAVILKSFLKKDFFVPSNLRSVLLILFLAINVFSVFLTKSTEFSFRKILFLGSILPLYFVISDMYREKLSKDFVLRFINWMVWGGAISFFVGIMIFIGQFIWGIDVILGSYQRIGPFFWGNTFAVSVFNYQSFLVNAGGRDFLRMSSFFPDPHNFALFAGIICFLSLSLFLHQVEKRVYRLRIFSYGAIFLLSVLSVFLSFSRGAYLALLGSALVFAVLLFKDRRASKESDLMKVDKKSRHTTFAYILLGIILSAIFVFSPIKNRFIDIFSSDDGSNLGRIQITKDGFDIFREHLLFGVGIGNAPLYYEEDVDYRSPVNSHNTYLEIAIENGLLGLSVWLILIFGTIFSCIKHFRKEKDEWIKGLSLGIIGGMVFFAVHSFFEVFLYSLINLSALMILLALSSIILTKESDDHR